jgi:C_GCAxxG_C_C family probable redox protein
MQDARAAIDRYFYIGGFNCAETTLTVLRESGLVQIDPAATRMMTGFGGGMTKGYVCGAVIAAVAALGQRYGRTSPDEDRDTSKQKVSEFLDRFSKHYSSVNCADLIRDFKSKTPEQYEHCKHILLAAIEAFQQTVKEER